MQVLHLRKTEPHVFSLHDFICKDDEGVMKVSEKDSYMLTLLLLLASTLMCSSYLKTVISCEDATLTLKLRKPSEDITSTFHLHCTVNRSFQ